MGVQISITTGKVTHCILVVLEPHTDDITSCQTPSTTTSESRSNITQSLFSRATIRPNRVDLFSTPLPRPAHLRLATPSETYFPSDRHVRERDGTNNLANTRSGIREREIGKNGRVGT